SASPEAAAAVVTMAAQIDASATLSSIRAPTLVLHRRGDVVVPYDRGEALAAGIDGAELVGLDGLADHPLCAAPDEGVAEVASVVTGRVEPTAGERGRATMLLADVVAGPGAGPAAVDRLRERLRAEVTQGSEGAGQVWSGGVAGVLATFDG